MHLAASVLALHLNSRPVVRFLLLDHRFLIPSHSSSSSPSFSGGVAHRAPRARRVRASHCRYHRSANTLRMVSSHLLTSPSLIFSPFLFSPWHPLLCSSSTMEEQCSGLTGRRMARYACAFGGEDGSIFFGMDAAETVSVTPRRKTVRQQRLQRLLRLVAAVVVVAIAAVGGEATATSMVAPAVAFDCHPNFSGVIAESTVPFARLERRPNHPSTPQDPSNPATLTRGNARVTMRIATVPGAASASC